MGSESEVICKRKHNQKQSVCTHESLKFLGAYSRMYAKINGFVEPWITNLRAGGFKTTIGLG